HCVLLRYHVCMTTNRTYFGFTTAQQRRLLFEIWEQIGNVTEACRVARVGRRTFYYWKPRFDAHGYAGLESFASSAPNHPNPVAKTLHDQVIALRQANPEWANAVLHRRWPKPTSGKLSSAPIPSSASLSMLS